MRKYVLLLVLAVTFASAHNAAAQRERQVQPSGQDETSKKFFDQLRSLFGRFRDADLKRAFETAQPVPCSELISGDGEWRPVAFFNEDRRLGDWYHSSLDEVKSEFSTYIFKGSCKTEQSTIQLVTKFPVRDSLDRYGDGRIHFNEIAVNVNTAVNVAYDSRSTAYSFDLPFLYAVRERGVQETVYSLVAQSNGDHPVTSVTNQWDCKSVHANDVTFQFIICDTRTAPRVLERGARIERTFGASAYFILSDGREAQTSAHLSFGNLGGEVVPASPDQPQQPEPTLTPLTREPEAPAPREPLNDARSTSTWDVPDSRSRLLEVGQGDFRIRFSPQTWAGKVGSLQVLMDERLTPLTTAKPGAGVDYCLWQPASGTLASRLLSNEPDKDVDYTLSVSDGGKLSSASFKFEMKTHTGARIGTLECFFPKAASVDTITFDRWVSIVGAHATLEIAR